MNINEIFGGENVVQGEGPFAGQPCTFIRTFGCIAPFCEFCDTPYSWNDSKNESKKMTISQIIEEVEKFKSKFVVITGGEPFLQKDIYKLVDRLMEEGYAVQMETSGKAEIKMLKFKIPPYIVMSPKQYNGVFKSFDKITLQKADCYKFVVGSEEDVNNVNEFVKNNILNPDGFIYLMGKGATREEQIKIMSEVMKWCCENNYIYSPRLHVLAYNTKRGV